MVIFRLPVISLLVNSASPVSLAFTSTATLLVDSSTMSTGISVSATVYLPGIRWSSVAVLLWPLVMVISTVSE